MAKPRARKNFRRSNGYRRYKQIASRNYFKVKAEFYDLIKYPDVKGAPIFGSREGQEMPINRGVLPIPSMYVGYTYANILQGLFSYYKLLSVAVEIVPRYNNGDQITSQAGTLLGFRMGKIEAMTLSEVKAVNQNILLDPRNRQRRYWKIFQANGEWILTSDALLGALTVVSTQPDGGVKDEQHMWDIKISMYLLFKYSKA